MKYLIVYNKMIIVKCLEVHFIIQNIALILISFNNINISNDIAYRLGKS